MQKIWNLILKLTIKEYLDLIKILLSFIPGMILKLCKKNIWIISERSNEARDNGFWIFNYILKNKLHKNSYYTITSDSPDLKKIINYKNNLIKYGSFKHYVYLWACAKYISAHVDDGYPSPRVCYKLKMFGIYQFKYIFLQHGVIHNYHNFYAQKNTHADKIICSAIEEKNFLIKFCNYSENSVKCVGLARFDGLLNNKPNKKDKILIMPTWRRNLSVISKKQFQKSKFYINFYDLLSNNNLRKFVKSNNLHINFFLHKELQKFLDCFKGLENQNISILNYKAYDVQHELKNSSLLITDFSSIAFDFAYMHKPLIYFQFDYNEFRTEHTDKGYFDYELNGFGEIHNNINKIVDSTIKYYGNNFSINEKYLNRSKNFFLYHDNQNCKRNFEVINSC